MKREAKNELIYVGDFLRSYEYCKRQGHLEYLAKDLGLEIETLNAAKECIIKLNLKDSNVIAIG